MSEMRAPETTPNELTAGMFARAMLSRIVVPRITPCVRRSSGTSAIPASNALPTPGECGSVVSPTVMVPGRVLLSSGQDAHQLAAARAGEASDAEHFALVGGERDVLHAPTVEPLHRERHLCRGRGALRVQLSAGPADHVRDDLVDVGVGDILRDDRLAVAHDREAIAELEDLLEAMRHVEDRDPFIAQAAAAPRTAR